MSIFKETFPDFVTSQLTSREKTLFNKGSDNSNFFIEHVQRQCTIRLSSGVDIHDQNFLETHERGKEQFKTAQDWVLQGGIALEKSGFAKPDGAYGGVNTRSNNSEDGFGIVPMPGIIDAQITTKTAYGSLRSAKVKFVCHNRRQLEILELLYMRPGYTLLLEWGWGTFNTSSSTDGSSSTQSLSNKMDIYDMFWEKQTLQHEMEKAIETSKISTEGNYDALIGYCKNFSYQSRSDGGYECETEIIAKGEVIESLKASEKSFSSFKDDHGEAKELITLHPMQQILEYLTNFGDAKKDQNDMDTGAEHDVTSKDAFKLLKQKLKEMMWANSRPNNQTGGIPKGGVHPYILAKDTLFVNYSGRGGIHDQAYDPSKIKQDADADGFAENLFMTTYVRWDALCAMINNTALPKDDKGQPLFSLNTHDISTTRGGTYSSTPTIMPLQMSFGEKSVKDVSGKITHIDIGQDTSWYALGGYDEGYAKLNWDLFDISLNTSVVRMPHDIFRSHKANDGSTNGSIWTDKKYRKNFRPMVSKIWDRSIVSTSPYSDNKDFQSHMDTDFSTEECIRNIGNIYLGCEHLMYTFKKEYYDEDNNPKKSFTLFKFLEKVWKDVNENIGPTHDFALNVSHDMKDIVRVIDRNVDSNEIDFNKIHTLKIQGLDSTCRSFTYNTSIPSSLTATIAIAAQAPDSIDDLDAVTFAAINKGIKDRFAKGADDDDDAPSEDQKKRWKKRFDEHLKYLWKAIHKRSSYSPMANKFIDQKEGVLQMHYRRFEWESYQNTYNFGEYDELETSEASSRNKGAKGQLWKAIRFFKTVYGSDGEYDGSPYYKGQPRRSLSNQRISSIIPLKFNGIMDGISGIKIGNVFKIQPDRLPIGYQSKDIHFIIMGESQKITNGQDWTTEIKGNLILLNQQSENEDGWESSYPQTRYGTAASSTARAIDAGIRTSDNFGMNDEMRIVTNNPYTWHSVGDGVDLGNPMPGYTDALTALAKLKFDPTPDGDWCGRGRAHNGNDIGTKNYSFYWDGPIIDSSGVETSYNSTYKKFSKSTPIIAPADGVVKLWKSNRGGYGKYIDLEHDNGYTTRYGHAQALFVGVGERFSRGDVIGASGGDTGTWYDGNSEGPHIHYEIKKDGNYENPFHHLQSGGGVTKQDHADLFNP